VYENCYVRLIFLLGVIVRIQRIRRDLELRLKLIFRNPLPRNGTVVRQVIGCPIAQRPLLGAARLPIPNRPVRNAPVLRHPI
jgi:hypothetical protein